MLTAVSQWETHKGSFRPASSRALFQYTLIRCVAAKIDNTTELCRSDIAFLLTLNGGLCPVWINILCVLTVSSHYRCDFIFILFHSHTFFYYRSVKMSNLDKEEVCETSHTSVRLCEAFHPAHSVNVKAEVCLPPLSVDKLSEAEASSFPNFAL